MTVDALSLSLFITRKAYKAYLLVGSSFVKRTLLTRLLLGF